jgi:hypothetical protein
MCDSHTKTRKETPLKPSYENHKAPKITKKMGEASRTLEESRRTFYTYHENSYKV